jgi:hypothetical protein
MAKSGRMIWVGYVAVVEKMGNVMPVGKSYFEDWIILKLNLRQ